MHPHSDYRILHEPESCEKCDDYPERQILRAHHGINFTGCHVVGFLPCPSEYHKICSTHGEYNFDTCYRCEQEKLEEAKQVNTITIVSGSIYSGVSTTTNIIDFDNMISNGQISHFMQNRRYQHPASETCIHCR